METGAWHIGTASVDGTRHAGLEAESRHAGMAV